MIIDMCVYKYILYAANLITLFNVASTETAELIPFPFPNCHGLCFCFSSKFH